MTKPVPINNFGFVTILENEATVFGVILPVVNFLVFCSRVGNYYFLFQFEV